MSTKKQPGQQPEINLYEVIQVERTATQDEIKKSYRKLALRWHPDKNLGDPAASEKFKQINHAYQILGNTSKRVIYDNYGQLGLSIAEQIGEDNVNMYFTFNKPWCKCLILLLGLASCCCCCCCCCFCCGKCKPPEDEAGESAWTDLDGDAAAADGTNTSMSTGASAVPIEVQPNSNSNTSGNPFTTQPSSNNPFAGSGAENRPLHADGTTSYSTY